MMAGGVSREPINIDREAIKITYMVRPGATGGGITFFLLAKPKV